ncbi:MAG: DNA polymerase III subunit gamma/tau [Pseudobdellovibrio sp.]
MSYQVLARKYRPQSFDQMIGQNHISQTLTNAIKNNRIPHALLFTGLRGTGKTSSARILAKTLRCENPVNYSPCNVCNSCIEISKGSAVDVIEIDGASNNGVDAIRDLRDNVMFMPTSGKYKIFIIDEVHMLSTSAFNALLKTLEEPPAHVIFMMATTEVHKIPQTILSRCQRFDLRRIPLKQITQHLKKICELENISADEKALWLIARQGDGSARDSLSLLDQVINFSAGQLTEQTVSSVLGLTDRSLIYEIFGHIIDRNSKGIIQDLEKSHTIGINASLFFEELTQLIRHAILLKTAPENDTLIDLPLEEISTLKNLANSQSESDLHLLFDMALKSLGDLLKASDPFMVFEVCLLRMAQAPRIRDIQKLLAHGGLAPKHNGLTTKSEPSAKATSPEPVNRAPELIAQPKPALNLENWMKFINYLKNESAFLAAKLDNIVFSGVQDKHFTLQAAAQFAFLADQINQETQQKLQGFIDSFFGTGYTFNVVKAKTASGDSALSMNLKIEQEAEEKIKTEILQDPRVQAAQKVFKAQAKIVPKDS